MFISRSEQIILAFLILLRKSEQTQIFWGAGNIEGVWKLPVFQVLVINIFYSHCCFEKPFSQVLLHLHDDLYELSIWHLWEGIGMRGGHQDHSWSPK